MMNFERPFGSQEEERPDHKEEAVRRERIANAERVFTDFLELQPGEKVLFLVEPQMSDSEKELVTILRKALARRGTDFTTLTLTNESTTEDIARHLKDHEVIWSATKWQQPRIDFYKLTEEYIPESGARMSDSGGVEVEVLDPGGALSEKRDILEKRLEQMEARLKDVRGFRIRTSYGTDLEMRMRPAGERRWFKSAGVIMSGKWDGIPAGAEIFTTPDEEKVNGTLMLPVLQDEVSKEQGVDKFVRLTIRDGKIRAIDGGESAEKLRKYLEENSKEEDNPESVLNCAEIAFGANSYARSKVRNAEGSFSDPGISFQEAEKRLRTMHIAFGASKHGEEGTEGHTESDVHLDFVIPRHELTVTAFYSEDDFKNNRNGENLIEPGAWRLASV